jgi:hypothetical protein
VLSHIKISVHPQKYPGIWVIGSQNRNLVKYPQFRNGHFRNVRFFKCWQKGNSMKFFAREHEIAELRRIRDMAVESLRAISGASS